MFDGSPIGLARLHSDEARVAEANEALAKMLGYTRDELVGLAFAEITFSDDLDDSRLRFRELVDGALESYSFEKRYVRKSGEPIWCEVTATALERDPAGKPAFVIAMIQNVTERKLAELALREAKERQARIAETQAAIAAAGLDLTTAMQLVADRSYGSRGPRASP